METFCKDIAVPPEDVVMLVLAYKMGAKQMGFFTQSEWTKGLTDLQCDSVQKIQNKLGNDFLAGCLVKFFMQCFSWI
jgi:DCN1-like protein 4/5